MIYKDKSFKWNVTYYNNIIIILILLLL